MNKNYFNKMFPLILIAIIILPMLSGCATLFSRPISTDDTRLSIEPYSTEYGLASWYGSEYAGNRTASGEIFNPHKLTAAHKTLPFSTIVRVTNLENGKSVVVRINDRGPFIPGRIIDLSHAAAGRIDMVRQGIVRVKLEIIQ